MIRLFGINHHQFADETQIYLAVSKTDLQVKVNQLKNCTVLAWVQTNGLQLNPTKSEVIQFTATLGCDRVDDLTLKYQALKSSHRQSSKVPALYSTQNSRSIRT